MEALFFLSSCQIKTPSEETQSFAASSFIPIRPQTGGLTLTMTPTDHSTPELRQALRALSLLHNSSRSWRRSQEPLDCLVLFCGSEQQTGRSLCRNVPRRKSTGFHLQLPYYTISRSSVGSQTLMEQIYTALSMKLQITAHLAPCLQPPRVWMGARTRWYKRAELTPDWA